ncbi:NAD kinase [Alicyclobacillus cellulosilyticus]|uniref:NAD kinase n=1 Tax=Alicyclobacillus cellulosilyticus TaxID=1003997 RepID=A0A917NEP4_9BACL|nr:NAD(+)/NADH kinase [Alicyclobacillus cellulosilyticus]GGI95826.1 NAD kinase [Alicyclobacillus cellulosilyticus]
MRQVGLFVNLDKPQAAEVQRRLTRLLRDAGFDVVCAGVQRGSDVEAADDLDRLPLELLFVLGGDGTLLTAARRFAHHGVPLLGINIGHLGFLSEAEPAELEETVRRVVHKEYDLERRLMLEAAVYRHGQEVARLVALNDAGIAKGSFARMITVHAYVDGVFVDTYRGDGIIVSTPTGSTAYSLSCGGPIIVPHLHVLLITPICPHTLFSRPCVIADTQEVRLVVESTHDDVGLTVDGQVGVRMAVGDEVMVRRSPFDTTLVKWRDREFFSVLRAKLRNRESQ